MLYTLIAPGRIITQKVLIMCRLLMFRYDAIRPPPKNMVKVNRNMMRPRKGSSRLVSGYAQIIVTEILTMVPMTV